jgi:hypothetical protein
MKSASLQRMEFASPPKFSTVLLKTEPRTDEPIAAMRNEDKSKAGYVAAVVAKSPQESEGGAPTPDSDL